MTIHSNSARDLGTAIRQARKQLGLTQPDLALASGVGVRFIVELEAGKPTVRLELVWRGTSQNTLIGASVDLITRVNRPPP